MAKRKTFTAFFWRKRKLPTGRQHKKNKNKRLKKFYISQIIFDGLPKFSPKGKALLHLSKKKKRKNIKCDN